MGMQMIHFVMMTITMLTAIGTMEPAVVRLKDGTLTAMNANVLIQMVRPATMNQRKGGSPDYANDTFCDDNNNNAGCNWDNNACCNKAVANWNQYCSECKCYDANES